ncbi:MAG: DUF2382 domain-containing protein, partial [Chloroflexi bacterium]|nr:DUF2382 domain-containing protein [Chloroflexota bacterium]
MTKLQVWWGRNRRATREWHAICFVHPKMTNRDFDEAPTTELSAAEERTLELREEELVAHKELRELGEVVIRTQVDEVPGRLEVEALREEVEIEREAVGEFVNE